MAAHTGKRISLLFLLFAFALSACRHTASAPATAAAADVYPTYGVHNPPEGSPCATRDCRYVRAQGEPADPIYPEYWSSPWTLYRMHSDRYKQYPPPYNGRPPAPLQEGRDYEVSYGASYYDSTWRGKSGSGAMMEHYEKRCLPIFPIPNDFTCSFISLGDIAYFVTYEKDRPHGMPPVCLFSPVNHPPRRDFIAHLPYSKGDSQRLGGGAQGYSFWVAVDDGRPVQTGVSPVRDPQEAILFGYAFAPVNGVMQPQSFYFSGSADNPPQAPMVSQNYTNFTTTKPDPATTWNLVSKLDPATLPACQLFDPPHLQAGATKKRSPTWADIGRARRRHQ